MQEPNSTTGAGNYTFTVGKLGTLHTTNVWVLTCGRCWYGKWSNADQAILIGERASLIEFPSLLLPPGVTHGSVVDIRVLRNESEEKKQQDGFIDLQEQIYAEYGVNTPTGTRILTCSCCDSSQCNSNNCHPGVGTPIHCKCGSSITRDNAQWRTRDAGAQSAQEDFYQIIGSFHGRRVYIPAAAAY